MSLLPCPFCGYAVDETDINGYGELDGQDADCVCCPECHNMGPMAIGKDAAVVAWNKRSTHEPCPALHESGGAWMIVYDDQDVKAETFSGHGAEAAAKRRFQQISGQWNAHLFARVGVNSFDAVLAASSQPPPDVLRETIYVSDWLLTNLRGRYKPFVSYDAKHRVVIEFSRSALTKISEQS